MAVEQRHVRITSPCPVQLDPARGRDGSKSWYCGHCDKSVHVLSNMTEKEARTLLADRVGQDLCVSYATHGDGTIRFRPEPPPAPLVPVSSLRRRAGVAAALGVTAALAACTPHERAPSSQVVAADSIEDLKWRDSATIPLAEVQPEPRPEPEEYPMVDGGIGAVREPLPPPVSTVEGGLKAEPIPEPIAVPGGLMVEPIPEALDEPCDQSQKQTPPEHAVPRPGGIRVRSLPE
jgi:hypothetical protein